MKHIIVGTAGHIDHGKTELVKALTGINTDRLKEEQERGITIDIGFAFLTVGKTRFGFVDVPGHERFVKNMLAGVHGIDLVILVVAADESIMPQTREHFDICRLLDVKSGLVAISKVDLVDDELLELVREEVSDFVKGSFLGSAPIVPVSARTGQGLDELKRTLAELAETVQEKNLNALPRLPIDRVFSMRGFGTVVTGTLVAGQLSEGDSVDVLPSDLRASVRGLQVHNAPVKTAAAGERTAVNLQGVGVDQLQRGDVLVPAGRFQATSMLDARLNLLPSSPQPVRNRMRVRLHLGTTEILARVILLDRDELPPGDTGLVQFRLEAPAFALPGDRYIIRRYSPQVTIGGGLILDAFPKKHGTFRPELERSRSLIDPLSRLENGETAGRLMAWTQQAGRHGLSINDLAARSGLSDAELERAVADLLTKRQLVDVAAKVRHFITAETRAALQTQMKGLLEQFHQANPLAEGMSREELRQRLLPEVRSEVSSAVINLLAQDGLFKAERDWVALASHQVTLSTGEAQAHERLLKIFADAGYQPPPLEEAAERLGIDLALARKLLHLLVMRRQLVRLGELIFAAEHLKALAEKVRALKSTTAKLDVATFKDFTGVTRKYAIPLLEYLDRQGVTRRVGNDRVII
jgi:selenocysteine-specific elongation factor